MRALFLPLLLSITAQALQAEPTLLDWAHFGLTDARPDAQARGPELLRAGPGDRLLLYDGVQREVVVLEGRQPAVSFPVQHVSDLRAVEDGIVVLDHSQRQVSLWSLDGRLRSMRTLPDLVPTAVTLAVEGDQVLARDIFGHGHPAATLEDGELEAPMAQGLQQRAGLVSWDGEVMRTEGLELGLPDALKASGQRVGDWLVVDAVVGDAPLKVERAAWHVPSGESHPLPVEGRLYAPRSDLAATAAGDLVVLVPRDEGLELLVVSP